MKRQLLVLASMLTSMLAIWVCAMLVIGLSALEMPRAAAQQRTPSSKPAVRSELLVSTEWLASHLNDPKIVVLHIARERAHYDQGHIPGARFIAWNELTTTRDGLLNELPTVEDLQKLFERVGASDEARLVLYGDNVPLSAARAYFTLDYLGHGDHTALLDGGVEKWKAEQRALSTDAPPVKAARLTPHPRPQAVVDLKTMLQLSRAAASSSSSPSGTTLIDARPADDYTGARGGGAARSGHIPGAESLHWLQSVMSKENTTLRPVEELRKLYETSGIPPSGKIVTYCGSGVQASYAYFVAKYLGYDTAMYDGSFSEWSKAEGTTVITGKERK